MSGARAASRWLRAHDDEARLLFVWMAMVPGDDRDAAARWSVELDDRRVEHLWDPDNRFGLLCTEHHAAPHLDELRQVMAGDERAQWALEQLATGEAQFPTWDAALFFRPGPTWSDPLPAPAAFMKQFNYAGDGDADDPGGFWSSHSRGRRTDSTWIAELERGMASVTAQP